MGRRGEQLAIQYLSAAGWTILAGNYRFGRREVDLVVRRAGLIAFVEVKTRAGDGYGRPEDALTWKKRREIEAVAADAENPGAFLSLGYAGWAPGQLDGEIQTGSWIHMEIEPKVLFSLPAEERWQHCIDSLGVDPMMIWMTPVNE